MVARRSTGRYWEVLRKRCCVVQLALCYWLEPRTRRRPKEKHPQIRHSIVGWLRVGRACAAHRRKPFPERMTQTTMEMNNVDRPWVRKVVFGLLAHGAGPISDKRKGNRSPRWSASRRILTARRVSFTAILTISSVCPTGLRIL
jgi:hypothetical protein